MGAFSDLGESSLDEANSKRSELKYTITGFKCIYDGCNATFKRPSRLKQHFCSHNGARPYKCEKRNCDKAYTHSCHLKRHIAKCHTPQNYRVTYRCPFPGCELQLSDEYSLNRHFRRKHEKKNKCEECGETFVKAHLLRAHISRIHKGELPYRCEECKATFDTVSNLKRHHRGHRTHNCQINGCEEQYPKWSELLKHVKAVHPIEYGCDVCGKKFKVKGNLRQHVRTHMAERPTYRCTYPECARTYSRPIYLKNHIKWKHLGTGGHKCTIEGCDRALSTKAKLLRHLAWHERGVKASKKREGGARKPRSDKGVAKRSMATLLSGLPPLPAPVEKKIINGESLESDEDVPLLVLEEIDKICSESRPYVELAKEMEEDEGLESQPIEI